MLLVIALIWIAAAGVALWQFGVWPRTILAWALVLGLGPVIFILVEGLGELGGEAIANLPGIRHADRAVERHTARERFSSVRIAYCLLRFLILMLLIGLALWWLADTGVDLTLGLVGGWWHQNFR
jgi:hypothetical protein